MEVWQKIKVFERKHRFEKVLFSSSLDSNRFSVLEYRRDVSVPAKTVGDFVKIHLDTGVWASGVLGCFCIDTLEEIYVKK